MRFQNVTYIVTNNKTGEVQTLHGIEALARYHSNDLYRVSGLKGRELSENELNEWERLTDLLFDTVETLPKGTV